MEPTTDNNRTFQLLEANDDVLWFDKDAFTVAIFKESLREDLRTRMHISFKITNPQNNILEDYYTDRLLRSLKAGTREFKCSEFQWNSTLDCQFLKIGSKGWQKGKLRIKVSYNYNGKPIEVHLEFSPDEPPQPESPLNDLRELPEYKQQL
jgi:hypothetical protein